jgi:5-methylcytosine-specific restriction endonuclease McrA
MPCRPPLHRSAGWKPALKQHNRLHAQYHSVSWRAVRHFVLIRDRHLCQLRLPGCAVKANTVDHIVEAEKGGSDDSRNLRAVCPQCHNRRHSEKGRWDRG